MNKDAYKYVRFPVSHETRWATAEEIRHSSARIDLTEEDYPAAGLPLLSDAKEAYVDNLDTHALIFGSTGSKKTRLFCMPMLNMIAKAGESFIVTDPKGELYAQTSGLVQSKGYKTVVINFRDIGQGDMWNPLTVPYDMWHSGKRDEAGMLLSDIAATVAAPVMKDAKDPYWFEAAQELAIAGLYTLMEVATREEANMRSFASLSSYGSVDDLKELCNMMAEDSVAYINYKSTIAIDAKVTASGIVASLFGMLRMFCINEKLSRMLSNTTFDMRKIGREKTAVYIIVPDEKTTYHFLATMFVKQVYEILVNEAQKEADRQLPIRVNFVLDEFCNLPKVPDMASMISAARSRNMRFYLVVQSLHQLKGRYGEDADTIKGNCDNWVFLTSKEWDLLKEISNLCGEITTADGRSRKLISTSELQRFSKERGEALIMHARQYPFLSQLSDISEYEMFGTYPPAPMLCQAKMQVRNFSLAKLMYDIENLNRPAPFPSRAHMLAMSRKIYGKYAEALGISEPRRTRRPFDGFLSEAERKSKKEKEEAERKAHEEQAAQKMRECLEKTHAKVEEFFGKAFADLFIEHHLYDGSEYDDDDIYDPEIEALLDSIDE